jgi:hypothetical protein
MGERHAKDIDAHFTLLSAQVRPTAVTQDPA